MTQPVLPKHRLVRLTRLQVIEPEDQRGESFVASCGCGHVESTRTAADTRALMDRHIIDGEVQARAKELAETLLANGKNREEMSE